MKGGFDIQWFNWTSPVNFTGADDFGVFRFNNNIVGGGTGNPVANFLLGIPTDVDQTASGPGVDGVATHYSVYAQDEWRAQCERHAEPRTPLRPAARLRRSRGQHQQLPARHAERRSSSCRTTASLALTSPGFAGSIGNSRILTADQAGLPLSLRHTDTNNIAPRLGIAWRPGGDTRTVLRAGYGVYYTRILGAVFNSLTGIHTSDNVTLPEQLRRRQPHLRYRLAEHVRRRSEPRRHPRRHAELLDRQRSQLQGSAYAAVEPDLRARVEPPQLVPRHLLRLPQHRPDDGAGSESDSAEYDRVREPADRGAAVSQLEPRQHARQRRLPQLPRSPVPAARRSLALGPLAHAAATSGRIRSTTSRSAAPGSPISRARPTAGPTTASIRTTCAGRRPTSRRHRVVSQPDLGRCPSDATARSDRACPRAVDADCRRLDAVERSAGAVRRAPDSVLQHATAARARTATAARRPTRVSGQDPNSGPKTLAQWFNTGAYTRWRRSATPRAGRSSSAGSATPTRARSSDQASGTSTSRR